jgi:UDP-glucose 4-epimerase
LTTGEPKAGVIDDKFEYSIKLLSSMRCLVLGGGFIGTNLSNTLAKFGVRVHVYSRNLVIPGSLASEVRFTRAALGDREVLSDAVAESDVIFHLASSATPSSSTADPVGDVTDNLITTLGLLEICRINPVRRLVVVSSGGAVYGVPTTVPIIETGATDPISVYAIHKLTIEKYLALYHHLYDLDYLVLRVANPYGPLQLARNNQGVVAAYIKQALAGQPVQVWGSGEVIRDFIYIDDVVRALIMTAVHHGQSRLFNVGCGVGRSINSVVADIERILSRPLVRKYVTSRMIDVPVNVLDTRRIREEVGWAPQVPWIDGLQRTIAWMADSQSRRID